jgi:hypothetical protein
MPPPLLMFDCHLGYAQESERDETIVQQRSTNRNKPWGVFCEIDLLSDPWVLLFPHRIRCGSCVCQQHLDRAAYAADVEWCTGEFVNSSRFVMTPPPL